MGRTHHGSCRRLQMPDSTQTKPSTRRSLQGMDRTRHGCVPDISEPVAGTYGQRRVPRKTRGGWDGGGFVPPQKFRVIINHYKMHHKSHAESQNFPGGESPEPPFYGMVQGDAGFLRSTLVPSPPNPMLNLCLWSEPVRIGPTMLCARELHGSDRSRIGSGSHVPDRTSMGRAQYRRALYSLGWLRMGR